MSKKSRAEKSGNAKTTWRTLDQIQTRLEVARIALPLIILGFMSTRLIHANHWLGEAGFSVPDLGGHWAQPFYIAPVPNEVAWLIAVVMVVSGLATAVGFKTRLAALVFASLLLYVGLADRLSAFTVTKMAPVLMVTLAIAPVGRKWAVDAWLTRARAEEPDDEEYDDADGRGPLRFLQVLPAVMYSASGLCKAKGDWIEHSSVIWTHLHSTYQTPFAYFFATLMPVPGWTVAQWLVLIFEVGAPLWLYALRTRPLALGFGIAMHLGIGLMFGPVIWFSLLMITLITVGFGPGELFRRLGEHRAR